MTAVPLTATVADASLAPAAPASLNLRWAGAIVDELLGVGVAFLAVTAAGVAGTVLLVRWALAG